MTTLIALSTKDSLVLGCDSLGTVTRNLIDPVDLADAFFDPKKKWKLKLDKDGNPILKEFWNDIYSKTQEIPYNQMTHVTKLFDLSPYEMGAMLSGISSIGTRTIKSLIAEFRNVIKTSSRSGKPKNYTVRSIGLKLQNFIGKYYHDEYPEKHQKQFLEIMIGGYNKQAHHPSIYRIHIHKNKMESVYERKFGIAFGGQMREIQRIVFGVDWENRIKVIMRFDELFKKYHELLQDHLKREKISIELPKHSKFTDKLKVYDNWEFDRFVAPWGDFSEQNAIECVHFFVEIMIKTQQFSSTMPTVGGDVHIALITKEGGFKYISREEYEHEGYRTPIKEKNK